jgi:uncharacterized protein (TIGR02246 family)
VDDPADITALIRRYAAAWRAGDREAWLDTFCDDATQEDPIGDGVRRGRDGIGGFWDRGMAGCEWLEIQARAIHVAGGEAALEWTIVERVDDGYVTFDGVDVFTFRDGLIATVRAYWSRDQRRHTSTPP